MSTHARLAPSNHRWVHCPGSVSEESKYPDVAGEAAIDGTGSHLLLELCLEAGVNASHYDGHIIGANHEDKPNGWLVDEERCKRVQLALDYINNRVETLKAQCESHQEVVVLTESKSNPGELFGRDDWYGTVDVTLLIKHVNVGMIFFCETIDYKDGQLWVDEKDNPQLIGYAAGKNDYAIKEMLRGAKVPRDYRIQMTVIQPKVTRPIRTTMVTITELLEKAKHLAERAALTDNSQAPLIPDNKAGKGHCRWCKHKENCAALAAKNAEALSVMTNDTDAGNLPVIQQIMSAVTDIQLIDSEQLSKMLDAEAAVTEVFGRLKDEAQRRIKQEGESIPGYDMQPGRVSKIWNADEEEIVKMLKGKRLNKADIYKETLITPAQALKHEKLDKKQREKVAEFISEKAGELKLTRVAREVSTTDDSQLGNSAENMFAAVAAPEGDSQPAANKPSFW